MTIRIGQLTDTHFLEADAEQEGGYGYDTVVAFHAVRAHVATQPELDLIVVTGDVADHGRHAQYRVALEALEHLPAPVMVTPGNHDQDAAFRVGMGTTKVSTPRVVHRENWCFVFVDSNAGVMVDDGTGHKVDPDYPDRLHKNGRLGPAESAWLRQVCENTDAEHVFVWVHHPPKARVLMATDTSYNAEWSGLLADLPIIRGIGAGHTHSPEKTELEGRPIYVCPSLKANFDLDANTLLPPGWMSYVFESDGRVTNQIHLVDDERWPRHPLPRSVVALLNGELTNAEFQAIVDRKAQG